ncbi:flagellar hook-length control protein FliK [Pantoea brenneri]|uniref:flagellar hook-length control protein FliK n=1 Tax=Pantoea brenneri TaxID=472694 RepID=UPI00289B5771|nr:flagellar hook-length control protein FliK [Pantoea brenneri]
MMVAKVAAIQPVAGTRLAQDEMPADAQAFSRVLDEKTTGSTAKSPLPSRGQPKGKAAKPADDTPTGVADQHGTGSAENSASESLMVWLNQLHDSLPTEETAEKVTLSAQDDALPDGGLPFGVAQPLAQMIVPDVTPQTVETAPLAVEPAAQTVAAGPLSAERAASDQPGVAMAEAAVLPVTADPSTGLAEEGGAADFTQPATPAAVRQPAADQQLVQADATAIIPFSVMSAAAEQPPATLQQAITAMPLKVAAPAHPAEPVAAQPELALSSAALHPSDSAAGTEPPAASGQLTQQMGTPAWQQSLGQQLACFTRNGIQHAELRLHPEELGSIQITLQLKNEQAQMHFVSASHQVRAAIEAAVPHLRSSLAESGIELGQSSVGADSSSGWNESGQPEQADRQNFAQAQRSEINQNREEHIEKTVRTVSYSTGVNTFA